MLIRIMDTGLNGKVIVCHRNIKKNIITIYKPRLYLCQNLLALQNLIKMFIGLFKTISEQFFFHRGW